MVVVSRPRNPSETIEIRANERREIRKKKIGRTTRAQSPSPAAAAFHTSGARRRSARQRDPRANRFRVGFFFYKQRPDFLNRSKRKQRISVTVPNPGYVQEFRYAFVLPAGNSNTPPIIRTHGKPVVPRHDDGQRGRARETP